MLASLQYEQNQRDDLRFNELPHLIPARRMAKKRTFQVAGHLQLAGISGAAVTGTVRTKIEATSQQEAEEKFKAFLLSKAQPVVSMVLKDVFGPR